MYHNNKDGFSCKTCSSLKLWRERDGGTCENPANVLSIPRHRTIGLSIGRDNTLGFWGIPDGGTCENPYRQSVLSSGIGGTQQDLEVEDSTAGQAHPLHGTLGQQ